MGRAWGDDGGGFHGSYAPLPGLAGLSSLRAPPRHAALLPGLTRLDIALAAHSTARLPELFPAGEPAACTGNPRTRATGDLEGEAAHSPSATPGSGVLRCLSAPHAARSKSPL